MEETDFLDRSKLSLMIGMEIPAIGLDSEASFKRLMRAMASRRHRQRRLRLVLACILGAATVVIGLFALLTGRP